MCQFGAHDVSFQPDKSRGEQNRFTLARVPDSLSRGQEFEIGRSLLGQRLDRGQSCAYYPQESREKAPLSLDKFAFARLQMRPKAETSLNC